MLVVTGLLGASFIVVSLVVGGRLLLLGLRTHRTPELLIGFGLFSMGGFAWPLLVAAQQATGLGAGGRTALAFSSTLLMGVGLTLLAGFTWQVFRPGQLWARLVVVAIALAFAVCVVGQAVEPGYGAIAHKQELLWLSYRILISACLAWCGVESLHHARISAKRQRVGLSDPVVTNRFLLWGACTLICTVLSTMTSIVDPTLASSPTGVAVTAPVALAAAVALWFAFLPPAFYTRWLLRRPA